MVWDGLCSDIIQPFDGVIIHWTGISGYLAERRRTNGHGSFASKFKLFLTGSSFFRLGSLKLDPLSFWF
jgi:hypothetical protein